MKTKEDFLRDITSAMERDDVPSLPDKILPTMTTLLIKVSPMDMSSMEKQEK